MLTPSRSGSGSARSVSACFFIQLCLVNHSSGWVRPNLFPMLTCCVLSNLSARSPNLWDCILSCVIALIYVCLKAWLPDFIFLPFSEALSLCVCLSGQFSVVRICCTVFFWMPNCLNLSLLLMRHFFCASVCQVNLLWCVFAAPCFSEGQIAWICLSS